MKPPNPGSDAAIAAGCICAVIDNEHGRGYHGGPGFVISHGCKLHWDAASRGFAQLPPATTVAGRMTREEYVETVIWLHRTTSDPVSWRVGEKKLIAHFDVTQARRDSELDSLRSALADARRALEEAKADAVLSALRARLAEAEREMIRLNNEIDKRASKEARLGFDLRSLFNVVVEARDTLTDMGWHEDRGLLMRLNAALRALPPSLSPGGAKEEKP